MSNLVDFSERLDHGPGVVTGGARARRSAGE